MKPRLPDNVVILYILAIGGALTFAYSFLYLDAQSAGFTWWILLARGLVVGAAAGLGMAKVSNALPRMVGKKAEPFAWGAFVAFLVVTPLIIAPVTYSSMNPELTRLIPDWLRWAVAGAVGLFIDAVTAGVALTSGNLDAETAPKTQTTAQPAPIQKPARAEKAQTWQDKPYRCEPCRMGFDSQQSYAAHMGHATAHKAQKPVAYAVGKKTLVPLVEVDKP